MNTEFNHKLPSAGNRYYLMAIVLLSLLFIFSCAHDNPFSDEDDKLVIDSISPLAGPPGSLVTIYGNGFHPVLEQNKVSINGLDMIVQEPVALGALSVIVPDQAITGEIKVIAGFLEANGPVFTVVDPPLLSSVDPTQGYSGYRVVILGEKLLQVSAVLFNNVPGEIITKTDSEILVISPVSTTGAIELIFPGGRITGPVFTYLPIPLITSVTPGRAYYYLFIVGRHFSPDTDRTKVYLGSEKITPEEGAILEDGQTYLYVTDHPSGEEENPTPVIVESDGIKSLPFNYVVPPFISDLSVSFIPNTNRVRIEIYGSFFGSISDQKSVKAIHTGFSEVPVEVQSWSPTFIVVEMIYNGDYHDVSVIVHGVASNEQRFRI